MPVIDQIVAKAKAAHKKVVLPEGYDPRVVIAANKLIANQVAEVIVLGSESVIAASCKEAGLTDRKFQTLDPAKSPNFDAYAAEYCEMRKKKNMTMPQAIEIMKNPLYFGCMMTRKGEVDGMTAGSIATSADLERAAFTVVGTAPGIKTASSCFVMDLVRPAPAGDNVLLYADCAVVPNPDENQLCDIAIATALTYKSLIGKTPKIAFLAFSTKGSAEDAILEKIAKATALTLERIKELSFEVLVDGEIQADASIVPAVAAKKAPNSPLKGAANILIFPDLNAGNICYKLTERLAGASAYGPILQGLARPVNDLSRGCSADDIYGVAAITICQGLK